MNINKKCTFGERTDRPDMRQEIIITTNYTIRALAMNFKKYSEVAKMGNYVRYVSGYTVVDRYGQLSKHYYAGSENSLNQDSQDLKILRIV